MNSSPSAEQQVAILAPTERDAELTRKVLGEARIECVPCADIDALCRSVRNGVGAVMVAEEAIIAPEPLRALARVLGRQPAWSDLPVLVLTARGADSTTAARALESLGNVTLLERPLRVGSLVSSARVALRARQRQYQIRAHIVERERAAETLREADRRKDEFLATLAHELRNPLAPISNAAYILHQKVQSDSLVQWASDVIERQLRHLSRLVEDLLDVARITHGNTELRRDRVDLTSVVLNAVETSQPLIAERRHEFQLELPPEPLPLEADPVRLAQVLANLLNNAAKYTPRGGSISLAVAREDAQVVIRITDNGDGIDAAMLPRIFDMFVQADNRPERSSGGLGIGLTLVRHFVALHGGSVAAASAGKGRGSEFTVRLPLGAAAEIFLAVAAADRAEAVQGPGLRILVVDDNRDSADSLRALLEMLGSEVETAYDGENALRRLVTFLPDLVLLDIGMPGMNGYEVARGIRALPQGREVMLVALTGWGQEDDRRRSRAAGFDQHLVKPVDLGRLQELLGERSSSIAAAATRPPAHPLH